MQGERIFNYVIEDQLGAGGFGEVWSARHALTGDMVAVKILYQTAMYDLVEALRKEALILHGLSTKWRDTHPGVAPPFVQFIDVGEVKDHPAIIMEMLKGRELRDELSEDPRKRSPDETLAIVRPLLEALAFAHSQAIVHRDVKPENVFMCADGSLKVMDLGIAKVQQAATAKSTKIMGSLQYMAPERFEAVTSPGVDVYAAGLIAWELLAGRPACEHDTPTGAMKWHVMKGAPPIESVAPDTPAWLAAAITRMVDIDPDVRVATAEEALALLETGGAPAPEHTRWVREPAEEPAAPLQAAEPPAAKSIALPASSTMADAVGSEVPDIAGPPDAPRRRRPIGAILGGAAAMVLVVGVLVVVGAVAAGVAVWIALQPDGVDTGTAIGDLEKVQVVQAVVQETDDTDIDAVVEVEEPTRPEVEEPTRPVTGEGRPTQSAADRQRETERRQRKAEALAAKGWDALDSGSSGEAKALFAEAAELDATNPSAQLGLGMIEADGEDFDRARERICGALRMDRDRLRAMTGTPKTAYEELSARPLWCSSETPGTRSQPGTTTAAGLVALGWQQYRSPNMEQAEETMGLAVERGESDPEVLYGVGRFALDIGEPDGAMELWCAALQIRPIDPDQGRRIEQALASRKMTCPATAAPQTAEAARMEKLFAELRAQMSHIQTRAASCGDSELQSTVELTAMEVGTRIEAGDAGSAGEIAEFLDQLQRQVETCVADTAERRAKEESARPPAKPY